MSKNIIDYTSGKLIKPCLAMSVPLFLSLLLQTLYHTADVAVAGQFLGDAAIAAVGATTQIINLMLNLMFGISAAVSVVCAVAFGAKDMEKFRNTTHTAIPLSFIIGIAIAVIGIALSRPLLELISTPDEIMDQSLLYIRIIFLGAPFSSAYQFAFNIFKSVGDTKRPLLILGISGIVNVVLNIVSVTLFGMGVEGVAIGTVASNVVSVIMAYMILYKETSLIHIDFKHLVFNGKIVGELFKVGIPMGLNNMAYTVANVIVSNAVNECGKIVIAANTIGTNINHISEIWLTSVDTSAMSMVGQNYGAHKYDRINKVLKTGLILCVAGNLAFSGIVFLPPVMKFILRIFTDSPEVMAAARIKILLCGVLYFLISFSGIAGSCLRGMGYSNAPTISNYFCICLPRIIWLLLIYPYFKGNIYVLYLCYPISWIIGSVTNMILYRSKYKKLLKKHGENKAAFA